jgi:hypothetical protein
MTKRPRRTPEELGFVSTRIAPETYAEMALEGLVASIGPIGARRQGHIRDELAEAFTAGEHQGVVRAVQILSIARANTNDLAVRAAMEACLRLLGVDHRGQGDKVTR